MTDLIRPPFGRRLGKAVMAASRFLMIVVGAFGLTIVMGLVLPVILAISEPPKPDRKLTDFDTGSVEAPPPPPEQEEPDEPEPPPDPPPVDQNQPLASLDQLSAALNPTGGGAGSFGVDFSSSLSSIGGGGEGAGFTFADLDQKPRPIYKAQPRISAKVRKVLKRLGGGRVSILFVVDPSGRVQNPVVQKSDSPELERPALDAIRKWRFQPGKRGGKAVPFRMRLPIVFPK